MRRSVPVVSASLALISVLVAGCTWVPMQSGAAAVRVIAQGAAPAGCSKLGEIEVEVTDKVGFYERNVLRVREELETMARNEALGLGANTVQPLAEPADGRQRFTAWRCTRS
jgi:hypothetical protein